MVKKELGLLSIITNEVNLIDSCPLLQNLQLRDRLRFGFQVTDKGESFKLSPQPISMLQFIGCKQLPATLNGSPEISLRDISPPVYKMGCVMSFSCGGVKPH